ncbi:hypothetical protein [Rhizobium rhizogenes]|uniref:hypothetical protein n=1 Tax=Rhizobium rhizogenes TaxID=359 RepID=UPI001F404FB8|nr:hypothetical protein [Rhizobium rhizogenes]
MRRRLRGEAISQEQDLARCVVRFGLYDLMASGRQPLLGISQHHSGVPWDDIVADLATDDDCDRNKMLSVGQGFFRRPRDDVLTDATIADNVG